MLKRIRLKEKTIKKGRATRCGQAVQRDHDMFVPVDAMKELQIRFDEPELDDGFIELEWPELSREKASRKHAEFRANDDHIIEKRIDRKAFDTQLQQDIHLQASRSAKRTRYADVKPDHARTNSGSVGRGLQDQRDTASSSSCKILKAEDEGHHRRQRPEFKTARDKSEQSAILRLLSRGDRNSEPPEGLSYARLGSA